MADMIMLREHIPLQQGLRRLHSAPLLFNVIGLREHIPLQQGLRPLLGSLVSAFLMAQRAYSITTRIKT